MTKSTLQLILTIALIAVPTMAKAQVILQARCAADNLDSTAALQRIEWARKCALTTNTAGPNSWFSSPNAFDTTFNPAKDYREINLNRAYSSSLNNYEVNYTYGTCRYQSTSIYTVSQETSGPTAGFFKWSATTQRPRPMYPIFETSPAAGTGTQLFPLPTLPNDCNLYQWNTSTGVLTRWTGNFFVIGYCVPS